MIRALIFAAVLLSAGSAAAAEAPAGPGWSQFRCMGGGNPAPLKLSFNRDEGKFSLGYAQEHGAPGGVLVRDGGFGAIFIATDGKHAYFLSFTEASGALMVLKSPVTAPEYQEIERLETTPAGQAALHARFGERATPQAPGALALSCTREGI